MAEQGWGDGSPRGGSAPWHIIDRVSAEGRTAEPLQRGQGDTGSSLTCSIKMGLIFLGQNWAPICM